MTKDQFIQKALKSKGWFYIFIRRQDDEGETISIHELYGHDGKLSWTEDAVQLDFDDLTFLKKVTKELAQMAEDELVFTEEELMEYNT